MSSTPTLTGVRLTGDADASKPLLLVGPSLGTSVRTLWSACATLLGEDFDVVGWDLPGHGESAPTQDPFTVGDLAAAALALADDALRERGDAGGRFWYAGDSVGGAVGLQLLLDHPDRVAGATLLCTGARIGTPQGWHERATLVRASGTPVMVESSATRWFGAGFVERHPEAATPLLHALQDADRFGYAGVCEALAGFDVRHRLGEIGAPVLGVAGAEDVAAPVEGMQETVDGIPDANLVVLDGVAHLAPAEAPDRVARLMIQHAARSRTVREVRDRGMSVRRAVLGDEHVERANANVTSFTREFQDLITQYAWGNIWTRPGLDRRSRSMITLTAMIARGHHEELAMHVRAARTNGLSVEEIKEVILQSAIYCGVPDANTAFRIAQQVLADLGDA